jgi:putative membrane protein
MSRTGRAISRTGRAGAIGLAAATVLATVPTVTAAAVVTGPLAAPKKPPVMWSADRYFVRSSVEGARAEIAAGTLAGTHSATPAVQTFGATLATDHTRELAELEALATKYRVPVPPTPSAPAREILRLWGTTPGFDCAFVPYEFADHQGDLGSFRTAMTHGSAPDVRAFAKRWLPVLQRHADTAATILPTLTTCAVT